MYHAIIFLGVDNVLYTRVILNSTDNLDDILKKLGASKKSDFAFYDLIYLNKDGSSITDDTLKVRVYKHNEWNSKAVLVIRKKAEMINGAKEDKFLVREEFDMESEALNFVDENFKDSFDYKFKLEKSGEEYQNENLRIWVEYIENMGISIEFGSEKQEYIEDAIMLFDVKERLTISVPEYLYNKLKGE